MKRLPDKPSELLLLALQDLEKCESDKRFEIDMSSWVESNGVCRVCLAGSVMVQSVDATKNIIDVSTKRKEFLNTVKGTVFENDFRPALEDVELEITPGSYEFDEDTSHKLEALNLFRQGRVLEGLEEMGIEPPESLCTVEYEAFTTPTREDVFDNASRSKLSHMSGNARLRPIWKQHMLDLVGIFQAEGL